MAQLGRSVFFSICLVMLLVLPLACSAPDTSANGGTPNTSTNKSTIQKLIELMPASVMPSDQDYVVLLDFAKARQENGISLPASYSEQDLTTYAVALQEAGVWPGTFHTGMDRYTIQGPIKPENVGYGIRDVDATIYAGIPPHLIEVLTGSFSPSATKEAFADQQYWSQFAQANFATEVYSNVSIYSWGDGNAMHLSDMLSPPCLDNLGRARPLAVTEGNIFVSDSIANVKSMIDSSLGKSFGLAGQKQYADLASSLTEMDVYAAAIVGDTLEMGNAPKDTSQSPLLKTYLAYATGLGKDETGTYMVLVIANPEPRVASDNAKILQTRIENVSYSDQGETVLWRSYVTDYHVSSKGNLVLAKLYTQRLSLWRSVIYLPLLQHE